MKNRTWDSVWLKNGRFFCLHDWTPIDKVGPDWDITFGVYIKCECAKCGKIKRIRNYHVKEVPDDLIDERIIYR